MIFVVREVSPVETGIFFWTFVVLIGFILFNMVLAVIFTVYDEKYAEVHADYKDDENIKFGDMNQKTEKDIRQNCYNVSVHHGDGRSRSTSEELQRENFEDVEQGS